MPAVAVGGAVSAMVAQNIGANKWHRVSRIVWSGIGINLLMSGVLILLTTLFAQPLLGLFLPAQSPAIDIAIHINHIIGWTFILMGVSVVVSFAVRANGAVLGPCVILVLSSVVMRFAVGFLLHPYWGADAIWAAFGSSAVTSLLLTLAYYWHGGWKSSRMVAA